LAFSALVRGAGSYGSKDFYLARFCIDFLLQKLRTLSTLSASSQLHRLHLSLISTISALPLSVLPGVLDEIKGIILRETNDDRKKILREAVFEEILERVGEMEKEFALRWLFNVRREFGSVS
jgi:hypothetical protein